LLLTPWILRALGPDGFAILALFFAFTGYFAALDLGIVPGTLRHVAAARTRGDHAEAGAFTTLGIAGFVLLGLAWFAVVALLRGPLLVWLHVPESRMPGAEFALIAGAVVFALAGCANVLMATLQGYDRFDLANFVSLAVTAQQAIGVVVVLRAGWGLQALVVNVGLGWALGAVLGGLALWRGVPAFRWTGFGAARPYAREALAFGGPMQVTSVAIVLHAHLDKFLLPGLVALAAVTPYELGSRVLGAIQTFPQMLLLAMLPAASAIHASGDMARLRELYDRGDRYLLTATSVMVATLVGCADRLFATWLGAGNGDAAMVLRWLTVATGLTLATGMASVTVRAIGRPALEAWVSALALALHLGLSLLLLPRFGLRGAAAAMLVPNAIASAAFMWVVASTLGWRRRDVLLGPHIVPVLAVGAGVAAGLGMDRLLPQATGSGAWLLLALVAGAGAMAAAAVLVATGYFRWREARELLAPRGDGQRAPAGTRG
jgi:O-antigen/teichoic acid export membrane protein